MAVHESQQPRNLPWERRAAQPQVRLTHADRDAVAEILRDAYGRGQLDEDEFGERLDSAMRAKVNAELVPLTEDLGATRDGPARETRPGQEESPQSTPAERIGAGAGHAGNYFFPVLAPLVLFLVSNKISPYMRLQALESLNFQLFTIITSISAAIVFGVPAAILAVFSGLAWMILPLATVGIVLLGWLVLPAVATIAALMGMDWKYPMFFRLVKPQ